MAKTALEQIEALKAEAAAKATEYENKQKELLSNAVDELKAKRAEAQKVVNDYDKQINDLLGTKSKSGKSGTRKPMSPEAKAKLSAAASKRWAAKKKAGKKSL